ncbi:hypothetical protein XENOCAPTIV_027450, partial [Xenoophorus captivus]
RWFIRLRIDPVRQKRRMISVPPSVGPDLAHWGNLRILSEGVHLSRPTSHVSVHRRNPVGMGRNVSVSGGGSTVARPHVSPH